MSKQMPKKISYTTKARINERVRKELNKPLQIETPLEVKTTSPKPGILQYTWRGLEFLSILAALIALGVTINEIRQNQVVQAWQILTTTAPGNSGKREAIQVLSDAGYSLQGIDLSCKTLGGQWTPKNNPELGFTCAHPPYLAQTNSPNTNFKDSNFSGVDLSDSNLAYSSFYRASLTRTNLGGANLTETNFTRAILEFAFLPRTTLDSANFTSAKAKEASFYEANLSNSTLFRMKAQNAYFVGANMKNVMARRIDLRGADLGGANLQNTNLEGAKLENANFTHANISGTHLCRNDACDILVSAFENAWAWSDDLPKVPKDHPLLGPNGIFVCPASLKKEYADYDPEPEEECTRGLTGQ